MVLLTKNETVSQSTLFWVYTIWMSSSSEQELLAGKIIKDPAEVSCQQFEEKFLGRLY